MAKAKNANSNESPAEKKLRIQKEKSARFVKLGNRRIAVAVRAIRNLGKLSNRNSYVYDTAQVQKIFDLLGKETQAAADGFTKTQTAGSDIAAVL